MIIAGPQYPAVSIDQLVALLIDEKIPLEMRSPLILDVRPEEEYTKCHIIGAEWYPRMLLCRERFETESMKRVGAQGGTVFVCGEIYGAGQVVSTFCDRGYNAVLVRGDLDYWRHRYPEGLLTASNDKPAMLEPSKLSTQLALNRKPAFERRGFLKTTVSSRNRNDIRSKEAGQKTNSKDKRRAWR